MPSKGPELSIITSMYNEGDGARLYVDKVVPSARKFMRGFEVVIADNGSTDSTGRICDSLARKYREVKIVHVPAPNTGKGRGIRAAIEAARGKYVAYIDGDLQQNPEDIFKVLDFLKAGGYGMVVGQRVNRNDPVSRKILSKGWNSLGMLMFGLPVTDIGGQPKVMRRGMFGRQRIRSQRWLVELELILMAMREGYKIGQMPVRHNPRKTGKSNIKMSTVLEMFVDLLALRASW